jgi:hypothetical protein
MEGKPSPAMAEYWNDGMMEIRQMRGCQHSNIPLFQYSNAQGPVISRESGK